MVLKVKNSHSPPQLMHSSATLYLYSITVPSPRGEGGPEMSPAEQPPRAAPSPRAPSPRQSENLAARVGGNKQANISK